jgi:hypothetical protein
MCGTGLIARGSARISLSRTAREGSPRADDRSGRAGPSRSPDRAQTTLPRQDLETRHTAPGLRHGIDPRGGERRHSLPLRASRMERSSSPRRRPLPDGQVFRQAKVRSPSHRRLFVGLRGPRGASERGLGPLLMECFLAYSYFGWRPSVGRSGLHRGGDAFGATSDP